MISRTDRLYDLAALAAIVAGIAAYLDAGARLRAIAVYTYRHPGPRGISQLVAADHARYESYAGVALILLGCAIGVVSAVRVSRRARVAPTSSSER